MNIEIRHIETGRAHAMGSLQEVANFLADKDAAQWEGFQHLGPLPEPEVEPAAEPVADEEAKAPAAPRVMRAKLYVESVDDVSASQQNVSFRSVAASHYPDDGSDENNTFAKFTPMAEAKFAIMNPALFGQFAPGDEFYADFTLAKKAQEPQA